MMSQYKIIAHPEGVLSANKDIVTYHIEGAEGKFIRWKVSNGKRSQAVYGISDDFYGPEGKRNWSTRWQYPGQHKVIVEVRTDESIFGDTWKQIASYDQKVRADLSWVDAYKIVSDPPIKSITPGANMTYRVERAITGKQKGFPTTDKIQINWAFLNYADDQEKRLKATKSGQIGPTVKAKAEVPGHHRLMAEITFEGKRRLVLDYPQEVIPLNQVLEAGPSLPARKEDVKDPEIILRSSTNYLQVMEKLEGLQPAPASKKEAYEKQKEQKKVFIDKLKERLASTEGRPRYSIIANYYQADKSKYVKLKVFASPMNDAGTEWMIIDWTAPQQRHTTGEYSGSGKTPEAALKNAIQDWNEGNRYPPDGGINYEFEHPNYNFSLKHYFTTDGKSEYDSWASILEWAALGTAVVGGVITAVAPIPGSRLASAALWSFVFSAGAGTTAGVINIGSRHSEGFANTKDDAFDALTILGSMLGAGVAVRWARGASITMQAGTNATRYALLGMIGTDVTQGVLIGVDQLKEYDRISKDPNLTPDERLKKLLILLSNTALTGGLVVFGVKGTKADLKNLGQKSPLVDPGISPEAQMKKLSDPNESIIIRDKGSDGQTTASQGSTSKHETTIQTNHTTPGDNASSTTSGKKIQSSKNALPKDFDKIYGKAPAAKLEIDTMADDVAEMFGGQVAKAPIKSQERAAQKIMNDYDGDATKIKDLARNTIIVSPDKMDSVVEELAKRGADVKVINGATNPLGYSGVNSTIKTQAGIVGEIQVNTPAMIYAKEPESMARVLLGDDSYNSIAKQSGIPGGQGHELYEQWRNLPKSDTGRSVIEAQSKEYYDAVRRSVYGN